MEVENREMKIRERKGEGNGRYWKRNMKPIIEIRRKQLRLNMEIQKWKNGRKIENKENKWKQRKIERK